MPAARARTLAGVRVAHASTVATLVALSLAATPTARADTPDDCISAAERAQPMQHEGKLRAARELLRTCSRPQCPSFIRSDCTRWLADLEASTPSIVVHATDPQGGDLTDVRVLVDGELVAPTLDGRDIPLDPGPHVVRLERAGTAPVEQRVVADVGVQHRMVSITLPGLAGAAPTATATLTASAPPPPDAEPRPHRSVVLPLFLGGVGLVSAVVGGILWGRGLTECRSNISSSAASCTSDQLSGAHSTLVTGDVLVGAGATLAVAGLVLWLVQRGSDDPSPSVSAALSGGAFRF